MNVSTISTLIVCFMPTGKSLRTLENITALFQHGSVNIEVSTSGGSVKEGKFSLLVSSNPRQGWYPESWQKNRESLTVSHSEEHYHPTKVEPHHLTDHRPCALKNTSWQKRDDFK